MAARTEDRLAKASNSPGKEMFSLLYKNGNSSIIGLNASSPPNGSPPAQYILVFRGASIAFRNLVISTEVRGQRPDSFRAWEVRLVLPVRSFGFRILVARITSSCFGVKPGKQPVLTHTSFSRRRCRARYGPLLLILSANLLPISEIAGENLSASNATLHRSFCKSGERSLASLESIPRRRRTPTISSWRFHSNIDLIHMRICEIEIEIGILYYFRLPASSTWIVSIPALREVEFESPRLEWFRCATPEELRPPEHRLRELS